MRTHTGGWSRYISSLFLLVLLATALLGTAKPAAAAVPGENGKIAFYSSRDGESEIYVMNPDGTDQTRLTSDGNSDAYPAWSPDGTKIAFASQRDGDADIYVMNADGSGRTRLTYNPSFDLSPDWSPDGTQIAFTGDRDIYVMDADGTNVRKLTNAGEQDQHGAPAWSPDGSKIAFTSSPDNASSDIYVMNADGSGQTM